MRKLTWRAVTLLVLATCFSSISYAQNAGSVEFYYEGPLDAGRSRSSSNHQGPLDAVSRPTTTRASAARAILASPAPQRVARFMPANQLRKPNTNANRATFRAIPENTTFDVNRDSFSPAGTSEVQSLAPPNPVQVQTVPSQVRPIEPAPPTFRGPTTEGEPLYAPQQSYPVPQGRTFQAPREQSYQVPQERSYQAPQEQSYQVPQERSFQVPANRTDRNEAEDQTRSNFMQKTPRPTPYSNLTNIPTVDPTRFGYRDGESFGFDNTRLYNPLEGPQLDLQGAPTADFGPPSCDEWEGFCRMNNLEYDCPCGGLKANPGHLGLPWLGSKDNCDQTVRRTRRGCGCKECQTHSSYESECDSCSGN